MTRVFVIASHPLLGDGVEGLLRQKAEIAIVGRAATVASALPQLHALRPDVIILETDQPSCHLTSDASRILQEGLADRVIALNLQNNTMCLYSGERKEVKRAEDLFDAVETARLPTADAPAEP